MATEAAGRHADYTIGSVRSKDRTRIGYRRYGSGAAVVLIQAAMATAQNYHDLAKDLATTFTVFVPDRRGRGMSPRPYRPDHVIARDVEDLEAVLNAAAAECVFGLSSGAVIALEAARASASIRKLALYEPPLFVPPRVMRLENVARYNREIEAGQTSAALVTALRIALGPSLLDVAPRRLIEWIITLTMRRQDRRDLGETPSLRELVPTMRYDFNVVAGMQGDFERFGAVPSDVLLLSGGKSPRYLRDASDALNRALVSSKRIEFKRLNHSGPWNSDRGGRPRIVAAALRDFFAA